MKLSVVTPLKHDGKLYKPGDTFEVGEQHGRVLMAHQVAKLLGVETEVVAPDPASDEYAKFSREQLITNLKNLKVKFTNSVDSLNEQLASAETVAHTRLNLLHERDTSLGISVALAESLKEQNQKLSGELVRLQEAAKLDAIVIGKLQKQVDDQSKLLIETESLDSRLRASEDRHVRRDFEIDELNAKLTKCEEQNEQMLTEIAGLQQSKVLKEVAIKDLTEQLSESRLLCEQLREQLSTSSSATVTNDQTNTKKKGL